MPVRDEHAPVVIKKYANRRLYNTGTSTYVTLEDLTKMVRRKEEFVVHDAKTGADITHSVLTQILFELENGRDGQKMLPITFLRQLISSYGDQMQTVLPGFLEHSMRIFAQEQERMRKPVEEAFGKVKSDGVGMRAPVRMLEEQARGNLEMFHSTMSMFAPVPKASSNGAGWPPDQDSKKVIDPSELQELREQIAAMQRKIDALTKT